jgi:hypothetical protein
MVQVDAQSPFYPGKWGFTNTLTDSFRSRPIILKMLSRKGREGAAKRWGDDDSTPKAPPKAPHSPPMHSTEQYSTEQNRTGHKTVLNGGGGDKYEQIQSMTNIDQIVNFTAAYCNDRQPNISIRGYKKAISIIGPTAFKDALCEFVGSVQAGEDPPGRGATLNKHYIRPRIEEAIERRKKAESQSKKDSK